jgi:hypothetical protein
MIGMGIAAALFGLQMLTNQDVIRNAKQLVLNIDSSDLTGQEKTDYVMKELKMFFRGVLPILLEAVIKVVVLDMQNKNGTLQTKIEEMQK